MPLGSRRENKRCNILFNILFIFLLLNILQLLIFYCSLLLNEQQYKCLLFTIKFLSSHSFYCFHMTRWQYIKNTLCRVVICSSRYCVSLTPPPPPPPPPPIKIKDTSKQQSTSIPQCNKPSLQLIYKY